MEQQPLSAQDPNGVPPQMTAMPTSQQPVAYQQVPQQAAYMPMQPQPYSYMPTSVPPIMYPAMSQPQKVTVADMTIPKKGKTFKIVFVIILLLLIAAVTYSAISIGSTVKLKNEIAELNASLSDKNDKIQLALSGFGLDDESELTNETLDRIRAQGAVSININYDGMMFYHVDNWLRISADRKTMLADVAVNNVGYYYYRLDGSAWKVAYAYAGTISCRAITKEAMEVVSYMGVEKKTNEEGLKYDCVDPTQNNKTYTFEEAIRNDIYRTGSSISVPLNIEDTSLGPKDDEASDTEDELEIPESSTAPKSASMNEDALRILEAN